VNLPVTTNVKTCLPADAYRKYRGQWIALNADGTSILASADDLDTLEHQLAADGEDPEKVVFDRVEEDDEVFGGAELV
jgi:hypothetical protein